MKKITYIIVRELVDLVQKELTMTLAEKQRLDRELLLLEHADLKLLKTCVLYDLSRSQQLFTKYILSNYIMTQLEHFEDVLRLYDMDLDTIFYHEKDI